MACQTLVQAACARGRPRRSSALPETCGHTLDSRRAKAPCPPSPACLPRRGTDQDQEGREGQAGRGKKGGARASIGLPSRQTTAPPHYRTTAPHRRDGGRDEARPSRSRWFVCSFIRRIVGVQTIKPSNHQTIKPKRAAATKRGPPGLVGSCVRLFVGSWGANHQTIKLLNHQTETGGRASGPNLATAGGPTSAAPPPRESGSKNLTPKIRL